MAGLTTGFVSPDFQSICINPTLKVGNRHRVCLRVSSQKRNHYEAYGPALSASPAKVAYSREYYTNMIAQPHDGTAADEDHPRTANSGKFGPAGDDDLRKLLSGFSHRCRNSLNGIKMGLYLFRRESRGPATSYLSELDRTYQQVECLLDQLQAIYRPMNLTMVCGPLGQLIEERIRCWRSSSPTKCRALRVTPPEHEIAGEFDPIQLGKGLDALARWRMESTEFSATFLISWRLRDGMFEICWEETRSGSCGASSAPTGKEGANGGPTNGRSESLAESFLARVMAAHGGRLEKTLRPNLRWRLLFPQFHSDAERHI